VSWDSDALRIPATAYAQTLWCMRLDSRIKMNDRDYLLIKATLSLITATAGFGVFYFTFDNRLIGVSTGTTFALWIIFGTYKSTIKPYKVKESEIIFTGFNLKGQIIYIAFWATMTFLYIKDNKDLHFLFTGLFFLVMAIEEGFRLIIFDFSKKKVIGLLGNKKQDAEQLTIEYVNEDNSNKIKLTDKSGSFILDKNKFTDSNWTRIVTNLDKIKMGT
jgi:hypothetical protein